jgi:hypothetical protein
MTLCVPDAIGRRGAPLRKCRLGSAAEDTFEVTVRPGMKAVNSVGFRLSKGESVAAETRDARLSAHSQKGCFLRIEPEVGPCRQFRQLVAPIREFEFPVLN